MRTEFAGAAFALLFSTGLVACGQGSTIGGSLFSHPTSAKSASDGEEEDDEGVDCVDGLDAATGEECDGGPSANQDDGEEEEDDDTGDGDGEEDDDEEEEEDDD